METSRRKPGSTYGQTVSVKYYVNQRLKARPYFNGTSERLEGYPIYVQITAKRKSAFQKSVLDAHVPPDLLDDFLRKHAEDVRQETELLRRRVLDAKPFDNEHFDIVEALSGFDVSNYNLQVKIQELLQNELYKAFQLAVDNQLSENDLSIESAFGLYSKWDEDEQAEAREEDAKKRRLVMYTTFPYEPGRLPLYQWVTFYRRFLPEIEAVYKQHEPELWLIQVFCGQICFQNEIAILSIGDWLSGRFDELFMEFWNNEDALNGLKKGVAELRISYPKFDSLFKS